MLEELQSTVASSFSSPKAAYNFFLKNALRYNKQKTISFKGFVRSLESLLPKRYTLKMFKHFWNQCAGDSKEINFSDFCILFDN